MIGGAYKVISQANDEWMHARAHGHDHAAGHSHPHPEMASGVLAGAVVATLFLVAAELVGGYLGHSISLISDALHNLSDIPTLLISWFALRWAARSRGSGAHLRLSARRHPRRVYQCDLADRCGDDSVLGGVRAVSASGRRP